MVFIRTLTVASVFGIAQAQTCGNVPTTLAEILSDTGVAYGACLAANCEDSANSVVNLLATALNAPTVQTCEQAAAATANMEPCCCNAVLADEEPFVFTLNDVCPNFCRAAASAPAAGCATAGVPAPGPGMGAVPAPGPGMGAVPAPACPIPTAAQMNPLDETALRAYGDCIGGTYCQDADPTVIAALLAANNINLPGASCSMALSPQAAMLVPGLGCAFEIEGIALHYVCPGSCATTNCPNSADPVSVVPDVSSLTGGLLGGTTAAAPVVVSGNLNMNMQAADANDFTTKLQALQNNPQAQLAIKKGIAKAINGGSMLQAALDNFVNMMAFTGVTSGRRLSTQRQLQYNGAFVVAYTITFPASMATEATAAQTAIGTLTAATVQSHVTTELATAGLQNTFVISVTGMTGSVVSADNTVALSSRSMLSPAILVLALATIARLN